MKRYSIERTLWSQSKLKYGQLLDALEAMDGQAKTVQPDVASISQAVRRLHESGKLHKLVAIILQPYEPTRLHAWWNAYWMRKRGITREKLIEYMTLEEIAQVATDFFLRNFLWIERWLTSPIGLGSNRKKTTPLELVLAARETFTLLAGEIQRKKMPSEASPPSASSASPSSP